MSREIELRRVVLLARSLGQGGAERQLVLLANGLAARGICVSMLLFYPSAEGIGDRLARGVDLLSLRKMGRRDLASFAGNAVAEIRRRRPELVYSFLEVPNLVASVIKSRIGPAKIVWGVRSSNMNTSRYGLLHEAAFFAQSFFSQFADLVIFNSRAGLVSARARGFDVRRSAVVPNGIDLSRFRPDRERRDAVRREWGVGESDRAVGLIARLDPVKDHETFLRACRVVRQERKDVMFILVGGGDPSRLAALLDMAAELGIADRVRWLGRRSDVEHLIPAFDLVALSSESEGFPNALGEAMACGVPVVSTDVGAAREIVGEPDAIVRVRDHSALGQAIVRTLDRSIDGADLRNRIETFFSADAMVERTLRAFATIPGIEVSA